MSRRLKIFYAVCLVLGIIGAVGIATKPTPRGGFIMVDTPATLGRYVTSNQLRETAILVREIDARVWQLTNSMHTISRPRSNPPPRL